MKKIGNCLSNIADEMEEKSRESFVSPKRISEFIGQQEIVENIKVFASAACKRNEPMDHVILCGPPGYGKTTLASIIATEMQASFKRTAAPLISKPGDIAAMLSNLEPKDVLFIDEIHRLNVKVEELLYSAMEEYRLDILIGKGPTAQAIKIDLPPFTLIGATTRPGLLTKPLRDRFGIQAALRPYSEKEIEEIVSRAAIRMQIHCPSKTCEIIAERSRVTPRVAIRLLRRIRDFADTLNSTEISPKIAEEAMEKLGIDSMGLDTTDKAYIKFLASRKNDGPVGIETISAALADISDDFKDTVEPYLLQKGLLNRTPRGRELSVAGIEVANLISKKNHEYKR